MVYPKEYIDYLVHFHGNRDFFECHEILEEYWKSEDERLDRWVVLIQLAVGLYHHRRGNFRGSQKMLESCLRRMAPHDFKELGLDFQGMQSLLQERIERIKQGKEYTDMNLVLDDSSLLETCINECNRRGFIWQQPSSDKEELIHRHTLRDRTEIIQAREEQKSRKKRL